MASIFLCAPLGLKSSEISYPCSVFKCPWCCRAANAHPGSARPSRGASRQRYRGWLDKACILSVKRFPFKLDSPVVLKTLRFCVERSLIFFFPSKHSSDCWLFFLRIFDKRTSGPILIKPFWLHSSSLLRTISKLCRQGSCFPCPPLLDGGKWSFETEGKLRTLPIYTRLWGLFAAPCVKIYALLCCYWSAMVYIYSFMACDGDESYFNVDFDFISAIVILRWMKVSSFLRNRSFL